MNTRTIKGKMPGRTQLSYSLNLLCWCFLPLPKLNLCQLATITAVFGELSPPRWRDYIWSGALRVFIRALFLSADTYVVTGPLLGASLGATSGRACCVCEG